MKNATYWNSRIQQHLADLALAVSTDEKARIERRLKFAQNQLGKVA